MNLGQLSLQNMIVAHGDSAVSIHLRTPSRGCRAGAGPTPRPRLSAWVGLARSRSQTAGNRRGYMTTVIVAVIHAETTCRAAGPAGCRLPTSLDCLSLGPRSRAGPGRSGRWAAGMRGQPQAQAQARLTCSAVSRDCR